MHRASPGPHCVCCSCCPCCSCSHEAGDACTGALPGPRLPAQILDLAKRSHVGRLVWGPSRPATSIPNLNSDRKSRPYFLITVPGCALPSPPRYLMPRDPTAQARHITAGSSLQPPERYVDDSASSEPLSSPVHISQLSSRGPSRNPSPFVDIPEEESWANRQLGAAPRDSQEDDSDLWFEEWNDDEGGTAMPSDLRPSISGHRSHTPLLSGKDGSRGGYDSPNRPGPAPRRATFRERDPDLEAKYATRKRYTYAAAFLLLSLISFTVQTETAVYIQHNLGWNKPYCML